MYRPSKWSPLNTINFRHDRRPLTVYGPGLKAGICHRQGRAPILSPSPQPAPQHTPTSPTAVLVIGLDLSLLSTPARAGSPVPSNSGSIGGTRPAGPSALPLFTSPLWVVGGTWHILYAITASLGAMADLIAVGGTVVFVVLGLLAIRWLEHL